MGAYARWLRLAVALCTIVAMLAGAVPAGAQTSDPWYFPQTRFRITDPSFRDYFQKRGGIRNFGYPVSRIVTLWGKPTQFFQRRIVQKNPDGSVSQLNLMDAPNMPYSQINNARIPTVDAALVASAPQVGTPDYGARVLEYVRANAPDTLQGMDTGFLRVFQGTVTLAEAYPSGGGSQGLLHGISLEMWGVPTSRPAVDPNNSNFVFVRLQRGVMHYDRTTGTTQPMNLADWLKQIMLGTGLPADLEAAAQGSPYYRQYDNSQPLGLRRPGDLPGANFKDGFEPEAAAAPGPAPAPAPSPAAGLRYGFQAHLFGQDQQRVMDKTKEAGFGWIKQQVRWSEVENDRGARNWGFTDSAATIASASGVQLLFSVVTSPRWSRHDRTIDGPPDEMRHFGEFMGALAARYRGRVQAYEVWNEQNFSREWGGGRINACAYVEMLRVAYQAIKAADPNAIVITGALTPTGVNDPNIAIDDKVYLEQMYQCPGEGFKRYADAVGSHMAGYNNAPEDWVDRNTVGTPGYKGHASFYFRRIDDLYSVMQRFGDARTMWITEYHWASAEAPVPAGYEWTTHLTEAQASDFLVHSIQSIRTSRAWVGAIFVWNLNWRIFDDPRRSEQAIFGMLHPDWSPRQFYTKLKEMPK